MTAFQRITTVAPGIPNRYHFIFGLSPDQGGKPFSLIHYLAIVSCYAVNRPDVINLYYAYEPSGCWWDRAKPYVNLIRVEPPEEIFGCPVHNVAHKADVLRLKILLEQGGIYLDVDVLCLRPFRDLQCYETVLGIEYEKGLCNAVILARPQADFIGRWLSEYRTFSNTRWNYHSVQIPAALARQFPQSIHVVDHRRFFWPMHWGQQLREFFWHPDSNYCADSYCVHLWQTLTWPYIGRLTAGQLWAVESEFCRLARVYIDPRWAAADLHLELPDNGQDEVLRSRQKSLGRHARRSKDTVADFEESRMRLMALPREYREAMILCDLQSMALDEAASLLRCTAEDLRTRLSSARELLHHFDSGASPRL